MLTHQDIQDMLQDFNLSKMVMLLMLVKEITRLKRIKLRLNQLSQIAMDQTDQRELTAWKESHFQCAQVIKNQRNKKVLLLTAEYYQHALLKDHLFHHNATKPVR